MSDTPFFTIGIPVYNTAKWVGDCIDSILSQNFDDFELICVDDGSTDNSVEILNAYAAKDSRIHILTRENDGPSSARNALLKAARGRYIYLIDSDDTMCPNVLPQAYARIVEDDYPDILQLGLTKDHTFKGNRTVFDWMPQAPFTPAEYADPPLTNDEYAIQMWIDNKVRAEASSKFIKNEFVSRNGITYQAVYYAREDADFAFRLLRKAKTVSILPISAFVYYLPREGSISTVFSYKTIKSIICHYDDFYNNLEFWDLSDKYRALAESKKPEIYSLYRNFLFDLIESGKSRDEIMRTAAMIEQLAGSKIKKLPLPKGAVGIICLMFRIIGIKNTMALWHSYLKTKGVIKD